MKKQEHFEVVKVIPTKGAVRQPTMVGHVRNLKYSEYADDVELHYFQPYSRLITGTIR